MECPICFEEAEKTERHHVIWRTDNGTDDPVNLLDVCCSCHALITGGNVEHRVPMDMACFYHQMSCYGLNFMLKSGLKFFETEQYRDAIKSNQVSASELDEHGKIVLPQDTMIVSRGGFWFYTISPADAL